ncbi:gene transfer agent family protein [Pseudooceanicola sp.]|uniref:gene transfer agent family protein n=1 Tax=Pseudooceanicola sp. TaxID=1914328 RepID=UPI0035142A5F
MAEIFVEWGGAERRLSLTYGGLLDIEEACGKVGIGEIYLRLGQHQYRAAYVYHVIRLGLIGGGMTSQEAKRLLDERFDVTPLVRHVEIALDLLIAVMAGIEPDDTKASGDPSRPYDTGAILASFAKLGISPESVRGMSYRDFVHMCRAFGGDTVQPPSEEEFEDMISRMMPNG